MSLELLELIKMKKELTCIFLQLQTLLTAHGVNYVVVVNDYLERLKSANTEDEARHVGVEAKEVMLRGMGSLNDIWICQENGHVVDDEKAANFKLEQLRKRLHSILGPAGPMAN